MKTSGVGFVVFGGPQQLFETCTALSYLNTYMLQYICYMYCIYYIYMLFHNVNSGLINHGLFY